MLMRVLCLHDSSSCAYELNLNLKRLAERLHSKHGIELVFINSPLTNVDTEDHDHENAPYLTSRSWYYFSKDEGIMSNDTETSIQLNNPLGLDVSILHLQQIWNNSDPFCGVLGIGQGAALAAVLPLFTKRGTHSYPEPMFPGLNLLILIHYHNQLCMDDVLEDLTCPVSSEVYSRLHIFRQGDIDGRLLYDACFSAASDYDGGLNETNQVFTIPCDSNLKTVNMTMMNVIGRFLVEQKKKVQSMEDDLKIAASDDQDSELYTRNMIRQRLAMLEQEALSLIQASIEKDPPKSLLGVVSKESTSDGNAVAVIGGWAGDRDAFRSEEFIEAGGAPCPVTFKLPRSHRL